METYKVKKGDTLSKIAEKYGTTVTRLASINQIGNVNKIKVGQVLTLPPSGSNAFVDALSKCLEDIENLQSFKNLVNMM